MSNWERVMGVRGSQGVHVCLDHPDPEAFQPEYTGPSLAALCRYAGAHGPYSVAQHACLVAIVVGKLGGNARQMLGGLHHDDSEIITSDVPHPVKMFCPDLQALEATLQAAVCARYNVNTDDDVIKAADRIVFANEVHRGVVPAAARWMYDVGYPEIELPHCMLTPWDPGRAAATYLDMHEKLWLHQEIAYVEDIVRQLEATPGGMPN